MRFDTFTNAAQVFQYRLMYMYFSESETANNWETIACMSHCSLTTMYRNLSAATSRVYSQANGSSKDGRVPAIQTWRRNKLHHGLRDGRKVDMNDYRTPKALG